MTDNSKVPTTPKEEVVNNPEVEDFFQRLPANFRWPKPSDDAVAAAAELILRMTGSSAMEAEPAAQPDLSNEPATTCPGCGGFLPEGTRFCVVCGRANEAGGASVSAPRAGAATQHHVHHHYHHLVPAQGTSPGAPASEAGASAVRGRAPGSAGPAPGGRAEALARQVVQDWAQAANIRHIDDLVELYVADATLIRSSVPPVRSLPAIREFLASMLEAGLGDVEMESVRLEVMGEIAMDMGRCKMLVPTAVGKRREERGKYLMVLVRQPAGTWKILADCWSSDLPVAAPAAAEGKKGK